MGLSVFLFPDLFSSLHHLCKKDLVKFTNPDRSDSQQPQWSGVNNLFPLVAVFVCVCVCLWVCVHSRVNVFHRFTHTRDPVSFWNYL